MAFAPDMPASARRHLQAAAALAGGPRKDVAGYLYGIAAECAIKAMMIDAGMRPLHSRQGDPFFAHFPELRTMLRDLGVPRLGKPLRAFIENDAFMNNWSTHMRYCDGKEIQERWVIAWAEQAHQAVAAIGT